MDSNNNRNGEQSEVNQPNKLCLAVAALPESGDVSVAQIERLLELDPRAAILPVEVRDQNDPDNKQLVPALMVARFVAYLNGQPEVKCRLLPEAIQSARRFAAEAGIVFGSRNPQQSMAV